METIYINDLEHIEENNFWFRAKNKFLNEIITTPNATILDVGCGTGRNLTSFIEKGYQVVGIDINPQAVSLCRKKGYYALQTDLQKEVPKLYQYPDYITALDFFEHITNPVDVFQNLKKISHIDTLLIVTVPSYQFLFSRWDQAMGHVKRYTLPLLCNELERAGWDIIKATYIHFVPLIPAILIRKIIQPVIEKIQDNATQKKDKFFNPHPILNKFLFFLYYPEFLMVHHNIRLPFGLSVLATAKPKR